MFEFYSESIHKFSLGDFVVRSTLPLVLAAVVCVLYRNGSAAVRHRVWLLGLAASIMVPIAVCFLPTVAIGLLPSVVNKMDDATTASTANIIDAARLEKSSREGIDSSSGPSFPTALISSKNAAASDQAQAVSMPQVPARQLLLYGWLFGVLIGATVFIISACRQSIQLRRLDVVTDEHWLAAVASAAQKIGLDRCPKTVVADQQCVPSTTGIFRPILIVPSHFRKWSSDQREYILLHELAHVRRYDVAAQCLARMAIIVHWFNPLVWFAASRMRIERELASDDCVLQAGHSASSYAEQLLSIVKDYRSTNKPAWGVAMAGSARLDDRILAILDPNRKRQPVGRWFSLLTAFVVAIACILASTVTLVSNSIALADEPPKADPTGPKVPVWKEAYMVRFEKTMPVSVALANDGKTVLTGSANGELMDLNLNKNQPTYNWKVNVGGSHPAIAYSVDGKTVYATTTDGVRILDAQKGTLKVLIEEENSQPIAVQAFPNRRIDDENSYTQIVFGSARGYFVKTWPNADIDKSGTIGTNTIPKEQEPSDVLAVPLAVDPQGRSAIMTGPIDGTGEVAGKAGANVLWAYVCGNYEEGSPGNRVMKGHQDSVVAAAWSKDGKTAITGDNSGRLIEWNATSMKEKHRREFGGRIAALSISKDGSTAVAYVLGKNSRVVVWNANDPSSVAKVIHVEAEDLSSPTAFANLDISEDGNRIAGCAADRAWFDPSIQPNLVGRVRVWELATAPRDQPAPKLLYSQPTIERSRFVIPNNHSLVQAVAYDDDPGNIDLMRLIGGEIQVRIPVSTLPLGRINISQDREWIAVEQQTKAGNNESAAQYDVVVRNALVHKIRATVSGCQRLLDLSKNGNVVAVVRDNRVELWDTTTTKRIKQAPFNQASIDAAKFSPDSNLLAISDRHTLVLWRWQEDKYERIELGEEVASLAFSPDGKRLAAGPAAGTSIKIRDTETKEIVQLLSRDSISVPQLTFAQGGRVLIACDRQQFKDPSIDGKKLPRIFLWDTLDGSLAHEIITAGPVPEFQLSPNERYLVAHVNGPRLTTLDGWRLDGESVVNGGNQPPASVK
jgi:beta-lactamase regulating signal transducer with metallopeptidase domain/WD40 repeat protein